MAGSIWRTAEARTAGVDLIRRLILVLAGALAAGSAFVLVAGFAAPLHPFFDSFAHFRLHMAAALGLAAVLHLAARAWRAALACAGLAVAGIALLGPARPDSVAIQSMPTPDWSLLQFNMLFSNTRPGAVVDLLRERNFDVVTLQEVSQRLLPVIDALADDYPVRHVCRAHGVAGVAVLSRFPLAEGESLGCGGERGVAWARVETPDGPITVASLHLHWPYPFGQAKQIETLTPVLERLPRPVLLAGDFNAAPWSHAVALVAEATDTRVAPGLRLSLQLPGLPSWLAPFARLPIDHALAAPDMSVLGWRSLPHTGSDHSPLLFFLAHRQNKAGGGEPVIDRAASSCRDGTAPGRQPHGTSC